MSDTAIPFGLRRESAEVYYAGTPIAFAGDEHISFLKQQAAANPRQRCRLCLHPGPDASQHEMVIVMHRDSYVPPHMHTGKGETFLVLEGRAAATIYDAVGNLHDVMPLGPYGSGYSCFYRMPEFVYHGLHIYSPWLVYVETTIGPFTRAATTFPAWAPEAADAVAVAAFKQRQARSIADFGPAAGAAASDAL